METKKFISTLKGYRTRFEKSADKVREIRLVTNLCLKVGGVEPAKEIVTSEPSLVDYLNKVLMDYVEEVVEKKETPVTIEKEKPKVETKQISTGSDGTLYEIDTIKKTCKRVYKDLSQLNIEDLEIPEMSMTVYLRYLKDKFPGEGATIKKGKLFFRGFRISCTVSDGFMVEDSTKRYAEVDTPFEGIPTPKELGDFFGMKKVNHTPEELKAAVEKGKALKSKKVEKDVVVVEEDVEEVDYEKLRKKVLNTITGIQDKRVVDFDPEKFVEMIPFKRWKRKTNALLKEWKTRKIRYPKFLKELYTVTEEETFVVEEKNHRSSFVGTLLPEFKTVGVLDGDKIEVDGKKVDAVPFLVDYILHYEPKAMQQIMRYANGEVTDQQLIKNPYHNDWKIEFNKKSLKNTAHVARVLTAVCESIGLVAPQDLLYDADVKIGDKIMISIDGEWKTKEITQIEEGICINKGEGLLKLDKWIKLEPKN